MIFVKDANADYGSIYVVFEPSVAASSWSPFGIKSFLNPPELQISNPVVIKKVDVKTISPTHNRIFLPGDDNPRVAGQCVGFVKYITGVDYSGNASVWVNYTNSDSPTQYSIVVINAGRWGHVGVVWDNDFTDGKITVRSRNWEGLWVISDNEFDIDDPRLAGYIDLTKIE